MIRSASLILTYEPCILSDLKVLPLDAYPVQGIWDLCLFPLYYSNEWSTNPWSMNPYIFKR